MHPNKSGDLNNFNMANLIPSLYTQQCLRWGSPTYFWWAVTARRRCSSKVSQTPSPGGRRWGLKPHVQPGLAPAEVPTWIRASAHRARWRN